ncbi:GlpG protein [Ferrimonas sediminum]|uniref:GlpG protein n=1 Tax=Ferrimonas sediminum TaxID=718193 RepID=A0A1G8ZPY9_9GAMM|nr:rhomboid family intramembrane serine protease GlpG [Ferrimonas sediminum]SDK16644.1 GlpG protein [Ferrimonas sediminum]
MISLGVLNQPRAAQAFVDYLASRGIQAQLRPVEQGVEIWVTEADHEAADQELQRFLQDPNHQRYHEASWHTGSTSNGLNYGKPLSQSVAGILSQAGPLTLIVMLLCTAIYIPWFLGWQRPLFDALHFFGSWQAFSVEEFWRLFTPTLIHFDPMHIVFNLLWWWYLGGKLELRLGTGKLMVLLLVGGTLPNLVQFALSGPNFGGLSGVVYALVGYSWISGRLRPEAGIGLPSSYMGFLVMWLLLGFMGLFNMANWAHLGGLLVGLLQGALDARRRY